MKKFYKKAFVSIEYVIISAILVVGMVFVMNLARDDGGRALGIGVQTVNHVLHTNTNSHYDSISEADQGIFENYVDKVVEDETGEKTILQKIQEFFQNLYNRLFNSGD